MSKKNLDHMGRWRSITIAFRVSPEENEDINRRVRLSGLTKQDYITLRCQERKVIVQGNPRVHKALKNEIALLRKEVAELMKHATPDEALMDRIWMVDDIYEGMKEDC